MKTPLFIALVLVTTAIGGCDPGPQSPRGFSLPEGDAAAGEKVFIDVGCLACHTLEGFDREQITRHPHIAVALGGDVSRSKTYAELVTSVINPSHKLATNYPLSVIQQKGESKMRTYNDVLTVTQLIDLVTFLQSHYKVIEYRPTRYRPLY